MRVADNGGQAKTEQGNVCRSQPTEQSLEAVMADVKLVVMYPRPQDMETFDHLYQDEDVAAGDGLSSEYARSFETFEKLYQEEHVPMIFEKLVGKTRLVATRVVGTPNGTRPPFYRIAEVHFPSLQALRACAQSDGGRETLAHAVKISSGGAPVFLVAEETTFLFGTVSLWDWPKRIASRRRLRYSRAGVE
jgi:uncharacterized protein (TIGR02118 family)